MIVFMNILPKHKREHIVSLLVEGNSLRGTSRVADVSYNTVLKFLPQLGHACADYMDRAMRELPCKKLQIDEIWSFVGCKRHNQTDEKRASGRYGDLWTFVALDPETKVMSKPHGQRPPQSYCSDFSTPGSPETPEKETLL